MTATTIGLLIVSNVFMTLAWYGHLKFKQSPLWLAVILSWGLALVRVYISGSGEPHRI